MMEHIARKQEDYMSLLSTRQKLVASNLANLDTPGYKTRDIDFQFEFLSRLEGGTAEENAPQVIEPDLPAKNDGNNVSLDRETRLLAETGMRFQMASLMARSKFKAVRNALEEGRNG
jgi:flagellar basal-body rod protein FlgB